MTRITVINPNTSAAMAEAVTAAARTVAPPGVAVTGVHARHGVATVESHADEAVAAVGVLDLVAEHQSHTDAYVVACFGDTGVAAAREVATCPVVGITEAALQTASLLAHRWVVLTLPPRTVAHSDRVVAALGLEHRCRVRAIPAGVTEVSDGSMQLLDAFATAANAALADGDEAVVLGCAGLGDLVEPLTERLGVPVVDGVTAAVGIAAGLVAMGLHTSRANTYAPVQVRPR